MSDGRELQTECVRAVALLSDEWNLDAAQAAEYAQTIVTFLPDRCTEAQLLRIVRSYHLDHQELLALRDSQHPGHQAAWEKWKQQAPRFLHDTNLDWLADRAADINDISQIALQELHESIASYRFNSRFSTWAYTVIVRAARRAVRTQGAAKRSATLIAIDDPEMVAYPSAHSDDPAVLAQNAALMAVINGILLEQGGPRWVAIFQAWAQEDMRLVDIGERVGLSAGRVSILLEHMRSLLRQHAEILAWYGSEQGQGGLEDER